MRARIAEDEPAESAIREAAGAIAEAVRDPEERAFVEPRLQHLLGLTERVAPDREELFSAWRLFVERMAEQDPVVMVFEDIQWADAALLEFVEAAARVVAHHPIFVLTLARPDLVERHPGWGARVRIVHAPQRSTRSTTKRSTRSSDGLVPGLSDGRDRRASASAPRACRSMPSRRSACCSTAGCSSPARPAYRVTGDLSALQYPRPSRH